MIDKAKAMITRREQILGIATSAVGVAGFSVPVEAGPRDDMGANVLAPPVQVMGLAEMARVIWRARGDEPPTPVISHLMTGADLSAWADALPNAYAVTWAEPETLEYGYAVRCKDTPHEIALATDALVRTMQHVIAALRNGAGGDSVPLVWRHKPEIDLWKGEIVEYRDDGPDVCEATGKSCVRDMSVVYVKSYVRFAVDNLPSGSIAHRTEGDVVPNGWELVKKLPQDRAIKIRKI